MIMNTARKIDNRTNAFLIRHSPIIICIFLTVVTAAVYWPVQTFDFVNLDDNLYVEENSHVRAGASLESIIWSFTDATRVTNYWVPLTWLSFILGLMAKPMLVTLPFVLLLLDYWPLHRLKFKASAFETSQSTMNGRDGPQT